MTAPQFSVPSVDLLDAEPGTLLELSGAEAHHAMRVRRLAIGESIRCADGSGRGVEAVVESIGADALVARVVRVLSDSLPGPAFVLVQALAKAGRDELAIEAATELGVDEVLAWQAERCVVRWRPDRAERSLQKWRHVVEAAAKQSRRLTTPVVEGPLTTTDVARRVSRARAGGGAAYVLHESSTTPLVGQPLPGHGEVILIVGPEGGISEAELEAFTAAGAVPVRLGDTVLRSSTAGPAALVVLNASGRWRQLGASADSGCGPHAGTP